MAFIRATAIDLDGNPIEVRYEGPREDPENPKSRTPVGYLKPSGVTYVNPLYDFATRVAGVKHEDVRPAHLGMDGQGNEGVSDQRWIYDLDEAARLEKSMPDRFIRVES